MNKWQTAQDHLSSQDPKIKKLIALYGNCTLRPHSDYYAELINSIISQQLSTKAAATIYGRFLTLFGDHLPTPNEILEIDTEQLRKVGLSYAKAAYIKDLAKHITDGSLDLVHIATLPNDELIKRLVEVKGIGEWSAHMFMIFSLGRTNILPTGDLGIRKAFTIIYGLDNPTPATMLQICLRNHWDPYQSVASWYLWKSLD